MSFLQILSASRKKHPDVANRAFFQTKLNSTLLFALLSSSFGWLMLPSLAAPVPAGTTIENQATGTYIDTLNFDSVTAESNIVKITVGEVAGITVTPASVNGTVSAGNIVYFGYTITNLGNDATQFWIPENATVTGSGVQSGNIQIIGYNLNGTVPVALPAASYVNVTAGIATGNAAALAANGVIQPGGSVTVRVPVKVNTTAAINDTVTVLFGDTPEDPASTATPKARQQNQAYVDETTDQKFDVYTIDNQNGTLGEFDNPPLNGDAVNHRQEASGVQKATVIGVDYGDAPDTGAGTGSGNYQTTLGDGGARHIIVPGLSIGTNIDADSSILQNATADADNTNGTPNDEDGVASFPALKTAAGQAYVVPVNVTNTTGQPAYLVGYIDFNQNGNFSDPEDKSVTITVPSAATAGNHPVTFTTPTGMTTGTTYVRLRLGSVKAEVESPIGAAVSGEVQDYALPIANPVTISGTVFEDPNYGGGAGRPLSTPTTSPRQNARVELYSSGTFKGFAITDINGLYKFNGSNVTGGVVAGEYKIRVVNSTVTSSRPNPANVTGLVPVQTFRTNAETGTISDVTDRVGGEKPAEVDAPANTSANLSTLDTAIQEVQSLTTVKVDSTDVTGINFGFNFDTIVNTNNTGQGSLRQFVANSNALRNTGLDQVANLNPAPGTTAIDPLAGVETSIFMIPASSLPSNGVAVINLGSGGRLIITNAFTAIDGRTQTINQGNTNNTILGDTSTISGVNGSTLTGVNGPEIELKIINDVAIYTNAASTYLNSIAITGSGTAAVQTTSLASNSRIENVVIGTTTAAQSQPGGGLSAALQLNGSNTVVDRSLILSTTEPIVVNSFNVSGLTGVKITNNEITTGNLTGDPTTNACIRLGNSANSKSATNTLIQGNYLNKCAWGVLLNGDATGSNTTILKNTIDNSSSIGILINSGEHDHTIQENIIRNSSGAGIVVEQGVTGIKVTQNSIYSNGNVGIDLSLYPGFYITQGLTPNNGIKDDASSTDQFGNNGMDYPVITYATLTSGNLKVKGFVGSSLTNSTFSGANLEFFIADNSPVNQNGEVILGDFKSKPHGEGRTYLGSCLTDANSQFNCSFPTAGSLGLTNPNDITATATDSTGNTSEFSAGPAEKANLIIVKRITAIKDGITGGITTFADFVDDPTPQDQNLGWTHTNAAGSYLLGEIDGGKIKPGDEVEYTMYYLNSGENRITQARVCDRLNADLVFQRQFSTATTNVQGIQVVKGSDINYLTNTNIDTDGGFFSESSTMPTGCNTAANSTINLSDNVVVADVASNSNPLKGGERGYIKFKVKIRE